MTWLLDVDPDPVTLAGGVFAWRRYLAEYDPAGVVKDWHPDHQPGRVTFEHSTFGEARGHAELLTTRGIPAAALLVRLSTWLTADHDHWADPAQETLALEVDR